MGRRNTCCRWMRSNNDSLSDSDSGKAYCGTCWQSWLADQASKAPVNHSAPLNSTCKQSIAVPCLVEDDDSIGHLDGFVHTDGKLYLISRTKNLIFLQERTENGKLQCVGTLESGTNRVDIPLPETQFDKMIFPFPVSPDDHCETPFSAYEDIACVLDCFASFLQKTRESLRVWDPFYCDGAVKRNFARLGFPNVHNECEDFYKVVKEGNTPKHDCIVTNPPYSTEPLDHIHELVRILCSQSKPWFVVQPNYVYMKPFWDKYTSTLLEPPRPFFLTPSTPRKYKYETPAGMRQVKSGQLKTSPFVTLWYCWLGNEYTERFYRWFAAKSRTSTLAMNLACTEFFLPDSFKDSSDRTRKKCKKKSSTVHSIGQTSLPIVKKKRDNKTRMAW